MKLINISDIFEISYGNKFDLNKMQLSEGSISFINRTGFNNGVVAEVKPIDGIQPYPANILTIALGGSILSTFLQVKPFYTGQNVAVATPKIELKPEVMLYYAAAISFNRFRYSTCGREANRTFRNMLVPSIESIPDWVYQVDLDIFNGADRPFNHSTIQPFNHSTIQPFNHSTIQPFNHLNINNYLT